MVQDTAGMLQLLQSTELKLTSKEKKTLLMEVRAELRGTATKEESILLRDLSRAVVSNVRKTTLLHSGLHRVLSAVQFGSTQFIRRMRGVLRVIMASLHPTAGHHWRKGPPEPLLQA